MSEHQGHVWMRDLGGKGKVKLLVSLPLDWESSKRREREQRLFINPILHAFTTYPKSCMGDFIGDCKNHSTTCTEFYLTYNIFEDKKKCMGIYWIDFVSFFRRMIQSFKFN